jgi:hypothetical protein
MANNIVVETHYTQHMNRPITGDSESYQQCNYQTFQMLVLSVVDQLNSKNNKQYNYINFFFVFLADEIRLKHLQNISENIEVKTKSNFLFLK